MKTKTVFSYILPLFLAAASALSGSDAQPLPRQGASTRNLHADQIRLKAENGKVCFDGMQLTDYSPIDRVQVTAKNGDNTTQLPVENWKWADTCETVDWLVIIDVSDSMRKTANRRNYLRESVAATRLLVKGLHGRDTLRVLASAADLEDIGVARADNSTDLLKQLEALEKRADRRGSSQNATTAFLQQAKSYLAAHPAPQGHGVCLVILSDGDDDGSAEGSLADLEAAALAAKVHVNALAFWQGAKNRGTNVLTALAEKTGGTCLNCNSPQMDIQGFARSLSLVEHKGAGSFRIAGLQQDYKQLEVACYRPASTTPDAELTISKEALDSLSPATPPAGASPEPQPAAVADVAESINKIVAGMPEAEKAVKDVAEAEHAQPAPQPAALMDLVEKARGAVDKLLAPIRELQRKDIAIIEAAVKKLSQEEGAAPEKVARLNALLKLVKDAAGQPVKAEAVRKMLGREADWPVPAEVAAAMESLNKIVADMPEAEKAVKDVAEAEHAQPAPQPAGLLDLVGKAKGAVDKLLAPILELQKKDIAIIEAAVGKLSREDGAAPEKVARLNALLGLLKDAAGQPVKAEAVRKLLGREADWPMPAPAWWKQAWVWGAAAGVVLLALAFIMLQRSKQRAAMETRRREEEHQRELDALKEQQRKLEQQRAEQAQGGPERTEVVSPPTRPVGDSHAAQAPLIRIEEIGSGKGWDISRPLVTIGRKSDVNNICINDPSVSSSHCVIKRQGTGSWVITDLGSANGVYINHKPCKEAVLHTGDVILLGRVSLRFTLL